MHQCRRRGERGLALVSVLWTLVILSLIAASLMASMGFSSRLSHNRDERARAEALAEAGIARGVLALLEPRMDRRWAGDGSSHDFSYAGAAIRISIRDELGKIDLNAAGGKLLEGLFRSAGLDAQAASEMADRVLDWRDPGAFHRLNGAKDAEYQAAGYSYGPRNGPFQAVDELRLVMGMTPALFARIAPALTVYSGRPFIDPQTAPPEALTALSNMEAAKDDDPSAGSGESAGDAGAATPASVLAAGGALGGRAFAIRAEVATADGNVVREAVVRLTDDPAQPYWVLAWR